MRRLKSRDWPSFLLLVWEAEYQQHPAALHTGHKTRRQRQGTEDRIVTGRTSGPQPLLLDPSVVESVTVSSPWTRKAWTINTQKLSEDRDCYMKLGFSNTERTTWDPDLTALLFNLGGGTKVIDSSAETDENNCQDLTCYFSYTYY